MGLHGRDEDLERIDETLAAVRTGRGRALFLTGEPGIGKSTLLAQARERAGADVLVLAGAAWESGGAPPYWPWLQVLRDAASLRDAPCDAALAELAGGTPMPAATDAAAARFGLLDATVRALLALAARRPLVVLLDDLHAADLPTLDLLVMFVRELPRAPIALVAAWRESELAVRPDASQRLARAARFGDVQPLRRLTADEVARWIGADDRAVYAATEGIPLFVEETLRARRGAAGTTIANVIADHLALASEPTRQVLATASVLGRDIETTIVAPLVGDDALAAALREAAAAGIIERTQHGWRYRHVLLRDALYESLAPSRRSELHRHIGDTLAATDALRAAHHLLAGASPHAVEIARTAAARAAAVYAFEDATALLAAALATIEDTATPLAIDLRLELAAARFHVGAITAARADCVRAAEHARVLGDVERLARAAMIYSLELVSGTRDPVMVGLLDEAERKLPRDDNTSRARVMARLGAALVPGPEPDALRAQELARAAIAMARRLGDAETLLFVIRYAGHAHAYQIDLQEAIARAQEAVALSEQLGRPLDTIDQRAFLITAFLAVRDLAASQAELARFESLVAALPQPQYRWRVPVLRATNAIRTGELDEAERYLAIAADIAREYGLDRALWTVRFCALSLICTSRDSSRAGTLASDLVHASRTRVGSGGNAFIAFLDAVAGRIEDARAALDRAALYPTLIVLQFAAEANAIVRDPAFARRILPLLEAQTRLYPLSVGPHGAVFLRPAAMACAEMNALVGRQAEAIAQLEEGIAHARAIESPPAIALGAAALARLLDERAATGDRTRSAALRAEAVKLARACGVLGIADAADAPARPPRATLSIMTTDARVTVRWNGRELVVPATKGLAYLAALVAAPEREIHVSDLIGDDDRGDAGEVLDAKARAAYRQRATELHAELDDARARNDLGRTERLAAELEAISDELLGATGLGGRARKAGSRVERARVNVQRRLKDAIRRLAAEDEALGRYLEATIRTGTFCSYVPVDS